MNVYTGLLFLQGHIADAGLLAEHDGYRQPSYGNHAANERALRERWDLEPRLDPAPDLAVEPKAA